MVAVSQYLIPDEQFWGVLPPESIDAAVVGRFRSHVSFNEIVAACNKSKDLVVIETRGATLVGLKSAVSTQPSGWESLEDFMSEHPHLWAVIPESGCTVEYVEYVDDKSTGNRTVKFPRLKELEPGRKEDPKWLLSDIVAALGLSRIDFAVDTKAYVATYY